MATNKQQRAFISYSRVNKEFATKLAKELRSNGYAIWFDLLDIPTGSRWDDVVEKALEDCNIFMIILTPAAIASENVKDEIGYAIDNGKRILPVLLEQCNIPLRLRRFQYVDFTTKSFEEGFESAKELLGDLIDESFLPVVKAALVEETEAEKAAKAERKAKDHADLLAKQKTDAKAVEVKAKDISAAPAQKKSVSKGLVIGIVVAVALVCLVIAGIGINALSGGGTTATEAPVVSNPTTELTIGSFIESGGVTMMYVPAGDFTMGSDVNDEKPVHTVYLDAYYMDKYEVTNAAYKRCVDAGKCKPPSDSNSNTHASYYGNSQFDDYPVIYVDWNMAKTYCEWRGDRLPTEAQWEKAARGTDGRTYPWGNDAPNKDLLNYNGNINDTTQVGSYESGKSPYGLYDMAGNVWEWVNDWYDSSYYQSSPSSNPQGASSGQYRALRGGSWYDYYNVARSAARGFFTPDDIVNIIGFRCARSLP